MYARVATATGWTWEYIGQQMTLPRLYALFDHWKHAPPAHESLALYVGWKPPAKPLPKVDNVWQLAPTPLDRETAMGVATLPKAYMRMPQRGR